MDFDTARHNMIQNQILPNLVRDERILDIMQDLPREAFLPDSLKMLAYADNNIDLGSGRHAMEPRVAARLIQLAAIKSEDVILSVGCGSGYSVAILASLATTVFAIEPDKILADKAMKTFDSLGIDNIVIIASDYPLGHAAQAPYDVIFFNGAISEIPNAITPQLAENGRLVAIVRNKKSGKAIIMTRYMGVCSSRRSFDAIVPILPGFEKEREFIF